ncbi:MAG: hypothetical protein AB1656_25475 [Candidatus Omnitrophota bacterium]
MNKPSPKTIMNAVLFLLALWPASQHWPWTKALISLWCLSFALAVFARPGVLGELSTILQYLTSAFILWMLGVTILPRLPFLGIAAIWGAIGAYVFLSYRGRNAFPRTPYSQTGWPEKRVLALTILLFVFPWMAIHFLLNVLSGAAFEWAWWTSASWSAIALILFYPRERMREIGHWDRRVQLFLAPALILAIGAIHYRQYRQIETQLAANAAPAPIAEAAFSMGYNHLGVEAVIREASRLRKESNWAETVHYLRSQWRHENLNVFARAFRSAKDIGGDLFLFASCFGCTLNLQPNEAAIDLKVSLEREEFWIISSQGRILLLTRKGARCVWRSKDELSKLALSKKGNLAAALSRERRVYILRDYAYQTAIPLPEDRIWKDIAFSENGEVLWAMDGSGAIEEYRLDAASREWRCERNRAAALWREPDVAKSFLPWEKGDGFFLLDKAGGVHWRQEKTPVLDDAIQAQLIRYYNPGDLSAMALSYWRGENYLMLLDAYGEIDFISLNFLPALTGAAVESPSAEVAIPPIAPPLYYDRQRPVGFYQTLAAAAVPLPEINTIMMMRRDGVLQAIAMPQRVRIEVKDKSGVISIGEGGKIEAASRP